MKINYRKTISFPIGYTLALACSLWFQLDSIKATPKEIRVGIYQNKPKVFVNEKNQPSGFWVEIVEAVIDKEKWLPKYIPCQWEKCLQAVEMGNLDLMVDVAHSRERSQRFDFNKEIVISSWSVLYTQKQININSIVDLDKRRVAVLKDSIQKDVLIQESQKFAVNPHLVLTDDLETIFRLIDENKVDAGVVNRFWGKRFESAYAVKETGVLFNPSHLHFIVSKDKNADLLRTIDENLKTLKQDPNSVYYQAITTWLLTESDTKLNRQSLRYIVAGLITLSFTIVTISSLAWNYILSKEIKRRQLSDAKRQIAENALRESEESYRRIVEIQTDFILHSLPDTTITFANQSLCTTLGYSKEQIVGKKWCDFANPEDLEQDALRSLAKLTVENPCFSAENRDRRADGRIGWTQWLNKGIFNEQGELIEIQSVGRDVTELKELTLELRENEERLKLVTENMSDLVCLHQPDGHYLYVTPSCQELLGYSPEELIGKHPYFFIHPADRDRLNQEFTFPTHNYVPIIFRMRKKNGDYLWLETLTQPIINAEGLTTHLQTSSRDVSDRILLEQQLKHDALYDSLTGLPNRALLMERLEQALKRTKRHSNIQTAILFLDLDHFKVINDSLGHLTGDQLLKIVANKLLSSIREIDLAARLGGDEFVILLEEVEGIEQAAHIAERILKNLQAPITLQEREVFVATSIGIVLSNSGYCRAEDLIRDADLAMYHAKSQGRGCYAIFNPTMHFEVIQRLHLEQDLRKALENQEFVLYYQPIVFLETLRLSGFEVLIRWQHPQFGLMNPNKFIGIAEETGLIVPIGRWVLQEACQQLAIWQRQFSWVQNLKLSINLSAKQLQDPHLLEVISKILESTGIKGEQVVLEITETLLVKNFNDTNELLMQLKSKGLQISIDDFGTGYSSLSYLHQLPVNALKIDRAFVHQIGQDPKKFKIVETIIFLSKLLELNTVAEGIETLQQLEVLKNQQCEFGQGFLFSKPVNAVMAAELIAQQILKI